MQEEIVQPPPSLQPPPSPLPEPPTLQDIFGDDLEELESLPEIIEIEGKRSREDEDTPPPTHP